MIRCKRCVMPDTRPDTEFVDGVCSACIAYEKRATIDWDAREKQLVKLLETHRRRGGEFDCIVPSSGGKDSTYQVVKLIELGARPLVVTATTCHLTDIGRRNIDNLAQLATTIEVSPNKAVRAKLNKAGLMTVGDISWPEHVAIFTTPFKAALAYNVPLIFYGENPQNEYGGPMDTLESMTMTQRWVSEFGGFNGLRPIDMVTLAGVDERDIRHYMPPTAEELARARVEAHFLGQYVPWDAHTNAKIAYAHGFAPCGGQYGGIKVEKHRKPFRNYMAPCPANWWPTENLDNAQTGLHDHFMYRKYGYGRGCAQISVDVRRGLIDREKALAWVRENDGVFPWNYMCIPFDGILAEIGVGTEECERAMKAATNTDLFVGEKDWRPLLAEDESQS